MAATAPVGQSKTVLLAEPGQSRYARLAWAGFGYTILVILFGAVVRVTHSGAGCGQHWPTCNGEILHLPQSMETAIEFTHRLTSGLALLLSIWVFAQSRKWFSKPHLAHRSATWVLAFMVVECLIGAALVLGKWVALDASVMRAVMMPVHLASASILCAAFAVSAYSARRPWLHRLPRSPERKVALLAAASLLVISMTGALTALGDTLFPLQADASLRERLGQGREHFLQLVRVGHPVLAVSLSALVFWAIDRLTTGRVASTARGLGRMARSALVVQLLAGSLNVVLAAPAWMQIVHLALGLWVWVTVILLGVARLESQPVSP